MTLIFMLDYQSEANSTSTSDLLHFFLFDILRDSSDPGKTGYTVLFPGQSAPVGKTPSEPDPEPPDNMSQIL